MMSLSLVTILFWRLENLEEKEDLITQKQTNSHKH